MIYKIFGYLCFIVAFGPILSGDFLTSAVFFAASFLLLIKTATWNARFTSLFRRKRPLPTYHGLVHAVAAYGIIGLAALVPSEEIASPIDVAQASGKDPQQYNEQATYNSDQTATGAITTSEPDNEELQACAKDALKQVKSLWSQLQSARYNEIFHNYGYSQNGLSHWEDARKYTQAEFTLCTENLKYPDNMRYLGITESFNFLYFVGKDWYQTQGEGNSDTQQFIDKIEFAIHNDGKSKT